MCFVSEKTKLVGVIERLCDYKTIHVVLKPLNVLNVNKKLFTFIFGEDL